MKRIRKLSASLIRPLVGDADDPQDNRPSVKRWPSNPEGHSRKPSYQGGKPISKDLIRYLSIEPHSSPNASLSTPSFPSPSEFLPPPPGLAQELAEKDRERHLRSLRNWGLDKPLDQLAHEPSSNKKPTARTNANTDANSNARAPRRMRHSEVSKPLPPVPAYAEGEDPTKYYGFVPRPADAPKRVYYPPGHRPRGHASSDPLHRSASDTHLVAVDARQQYAPQNYTPFLHRRLASHDDSPALEQRKPRQTARAASAITEPRATGPTYVDYGVYQSTPQPRPRHDRSKTAPEQQRLESGHNNAMSTPPSRQVYSPFARMDSTPNMRSAREPVKETNGHSVRRAASSGTMLDLQQDKSRGHSRHHQRQPSVTPPAVQIQPLQIAKKASRQGLSVAAAPAAPQARYDESRGAHHVSGHRDERSGQNMKVASEHRERGERNRTVSPTPQDYGVHTGRPKTPSRLRYDDGSSVNTTSSSRSHGQEHAKNVTGSPRRRGDETSHTAVVVDSHRRGDRTEQLGKPTAPSTQPRGGEIAHAATPNSHRRDHPRLDPLETNKHAKLFANVTRMNSDKDLPDSPTSCYSNDSTVFSIYQRMAAPTPQQIPVPPLDSTVYRAGSTLPELAASIPVKHTAGARKVEVSSPSASVTSHKAEVHNMRSMPQLSAPVPQSSSSRPRYEEPRTVRPTEPTRQHTQDSRPSQTGSQPTAAASKAARRHKRVDSRTGEGFL